ncbi:hypothetical protein Tco_0012408 [Tanacetum coccineum]
MNQSTMTGNLKLLCSFVEKFRVTVLFGMFSLLQFLVMGSDSKGMSRSKGFITSKAPSQSFSRLVPLCDTVLEGAFRKSTCFVRDFRGNDLTLLVVWSDIYTISLQENNFINSIVSWLKLHQLKHVKAKRCSFKTKAVPSSKGRLINLLHMEFAWSNALCKHNWEGSIFCCNRMLILRIDQSSYPLMEKTDYHIINDRWEYMDKMKEKGIHVSGGIFYSVEVSDLAHNDQSMSVENSPLLASFLKDEKASDYENSDHVPPAHKCCSFSRKDRLSHNKHTSLSPNLSDDVKNSFLNGPLEERGLCCSARRVRWFQDHPEQVTFWESFV